MQLDLQPNKWEFKHIDCGGVEHIVRFEADTWCEALQNFINFLRGSGFEVSKDSIAINRTKHPLTAYVDSFNDYYEEVDTLPDNIDGTSYVDRLWFGSK